MRKTFLLGIGLATLTLFSCKEKNVSLSSSSTVVSSEAFNPRKVDTLGSRYNQLGRFSGSILVAEEGEIVYQNFFGKADHKTNMVFTEETLFAAGSLSELFTEVALEKLKPEGNSASTDAEVEAATAALIAELQLKNTFFQQQAPAKAATGYVHSVGSAGPEVEPVNSDQQPQLWTTAKDLQKLLESIPKKNIEKEGYLENGGFSFAVRKNGEIIVVVLSNRRHPVAGEMAKSIEQLWKREPYQLPLPRKESRVSSALLEEYAGAYLLGPGAELKVVTENDSLFLFMGPQKVHLKPQSENQFFMDNTEAAIRFEKDSTGKVAYAELLDGFLSGKEIPKKQ
ncbi:DUF3471 domain-containing protein [Salinimicrobium catena]|uniref:DUF3471 domain-containing protein n=1 Tax=Salinimicrobium catena TaxID=390640 RepID=UPI002FE4ACE4